MFAGFADPFEVLFGQFPGAFDGLAAAGGEEHPVQIARGVAGEAFGEFDGRFGGVGPEWEERELFGLFGGGLGEL
ncbi:hypothetical protein MLGJGCBP_04627 [Rhodococcus sp. T7]|nr:hypothetical protein MLGJGCBP_04627 [Rhodococcus sp. T7]